MSIVPKSFKDEQAAFEYAMLWDEVQAAFQQNALTVGIRGEYTPEELPEYAQTKLVLESKPFDDFVVLLWGHMSEAAVIGSATLSFQEPATYHEQKMYDLAPSSITYYAHREKQTVFDREDIMDLRADLQEIVWNPKASESAARNANFFDV